MYVHVDCQLKVLESDLTAAQLNSIEEDLRLENPRWHTQERFGRWRNTEPRYLYYYERRSGVLLLPRGYTGRLLGQLEAYSLSTAPGASIRSTSLLRPSCTPIRRRPSRPCWPTVSACSRLRPAPARPSWPWP